MLSGILDKSQLGASQYGFVHSCYEVGVVNKRVVGVVNRRSMGVVNRGVVNGVTVMVGVVNRLSFWALF